ncbi:hypothetical protein ACIQIE_20175 [Streptomyces globisporus]|uniref:hypothetical protein n=1 Tax=Streptomyces globisporus TaxID=1908 RepID=UPI00382E36FA
MTARPFAVRPSGSRFYPWEWACLLHVADDQGGTKPCRVRRLAKTRTEAVAMATAHHNNLHPQPTTRTRAPEEPTPC